MTKAQRRLRELRERQSKERGRMAELAQVDELSDEQRSELDTIEKSTPDQERQIRAATVALEDEEKEAETRAADQPDAERRERIELRGRARLTNYLPGLRPRASSNRSGVRTLGSRRGVTNPRRTVWHVERAPGRSTPPGTACRPTDRRAVNYRDQSRSDLPADLCASRVATSLCRHAAYFQRDVRNGDLHCGPDRCDEGLKAMFRKRRRPPWQWFRPAHIASPPA